MTNNEIQIITLLKQGLSYSQIQEKMQVSSKTIAAAKKMYFPFPESNTDVLFRNNFDTSQDIPFGEKGGQITEFVEKTNKNTDLPISKQTNEMLNNHFTFPKEAIAQTKQRKPIIKLPPEYDLESYIAESAEMKLGLEQLKVEFLLLKAEFNATKKAESERLVLINKTKKFLHSCQDKAYTQIGIRNMIKEYRYLEKDCEQYCINYGIEFDDSECLEILYTIRGNLAELRETFMPDENGEMEYTYDWALRDLEKRVTFHRF